MKPHPNHRSRLSLLAQVRILTQIRISELIVIVLYNLAVVMLAWYAIQYYHWYL